MKIIGCILGIFIFLFNCSFTWSYLFRTEKITTNEIADPKDGSREIQLIEDEDVIEDYDNCDNEYVSDEDKMSAEDILSENSIILEEREDTSNELAVDDWRLLLINKQHAVPENYTFTLGVIKGTMKCDERIIPDLLTMLQAAKQDGVNLVICSPYRDMNRQTMLFDRKIKAYMKQGYSYLEAYSLSAQTVTVPGASEHQVGLALDIISDQYAALNAGFGETKAGVWLKENCFKFGFILRYPEGKEYITGIEYEPWHFRYRSEERRVWKECLRLCRSRWSPYH